MKVIDLFCGAGGFSLGFKAAGYDILAGYDAWDKAVECYSTQMGSPAHLFDLSCVEGAIDHIGQYDPDVIIGGPPCQDFSMSGNRKEGHRAALTLHFATITNASGPWHRWLARVLSGACRRLWTG